MEFDQAGFLEHMRRTFAPMDSHFTYELVENLIQYAMETHGNDPAAFRKLVLRIVPELRNDEIDAYLVVPGAPVRTGLFLAYDGMPGSADRVDQWLENMKIPDPDGTGADKLDAGIFLHGHCGPFALALNKAKGWPILYAVDGEWPEEGDPIGYLCHAWCCPVHAGTGRAFHADVRGITDEQDAFLEPFADFLEPDGPKFGIAPDALAEHLSSLMGSDCLDRWVKTAEDFIRERPDWFELPGNPG